MKVFFQLIIVEIDYFREIRAVRYSANSMVDGFWPD